MIRSFYFKLHLGLYRFVLVELYAEILGLWYIAFRWQFAWPPSLSEYRYRVNRALLRLVLGRGQPFTSVEVGYLFTWCMCLLTLLYAYYDLGLDHSLPHLVLPVWTFVSNAMQAFWTFMVNAIQALFTMNA